jgi:hypothetical protein
VGKKRPTGKAPVGATEKSHRAKHFFRPIRGLIRLSPKPTVSPWATFVRHSVAGKGFGGIFSYFLEIMPLFSSVFRWFIFLLRARSRRFNVEFTNMSNAAKDSSSANDLLKNSSLYREFQAEREEILRHKWIESEKAGRDIGFEQALTDWIIKHRSTWRKNRQTAAMN